MAPPGPVKISHKKDGCQRQPHRFHVSRPPLTWPLDPLLLEPYCTGTGTPPPHLAGQVYYVVRVVSNQAVGIQLKCLPVLL